MASSSSSSFPNTKGGKFIIILLIVGIMATAVSNAMTTLNNERLVQQQKDDLQRQASITRGQVAAHNNDTHRALEIIEGNLEMQAPFLEKFNMHINQTATAAPIVVTLQPLIQENNKLLKQILQEINSTEAP